MALPLIALPIEVGLGVVTGFEDHGRIALGLGGFLERSLVLCPGVKTRGERAALELCPFERQFFVPYCMHKIQMSPSGEFQLTALIQFTRIKCPLVDGRMNISSGIASETMLPLAHL